MITIDGLQRQQLTSRVMSFGQLGQDHRCYEAAVGSIQLKRIFHLRYDISAGLRGTLILLVNALAKSRLVIPFFFRNSKRKSIPNEETKGLVTGPVLKTPGVIYIIKYSTRQNILSNLGFEIKFNALDPYYPSRFERLNLYKLVKVTTKTISASSFIPSNISQIARK